MDKFLTYLNTRQHFTNHRRGDGFDNSFYLSDKELQRWSITRMQLEAMPQVIKVDYNKYNVQGVNEIDVTLLKPKGKPLSSLHRYMLDCLCKVDLPIEVEHTAYFETFLKHRSRFLELFFKVDHFSNRVHSPISCMHRTIRPYLLLDGEQTTSFDVAQMQPMLLGLILTDNVGDNAFSDTINTGTDIYIMLQHKSQLKTRDEAKKLFFEILFSKPSDKLEKIFDNADWIDWINWYKSNIDNRNPHSERKPYSNLAWILQTYEVDMMSKVWAQLMKQRIKFLSIHDEIICKFSDSNEVRRAFESVLRNKFKSYKLNEQAGIYNQPAPAPQPSKLSLSDIALQVIGEHASLSRQAIINRMIQMYSIDDTRAETGLKSLIDNRIISEVHFGNLFYLINSTPF